MWQTRSNPSRWSTDGAAWRADRTCWTTDTAYHNVRTVILDDSDKPEYLAEVDKFAREPGLEVVRRTNRKGFKAGNLNNYLRRGGYDYFVILDSDEIIPHDFVDRCLDYFQDPFVGRTVEVRSKHVQTQAGDPSNSAYVENVLWMESRVAFATINVPGSNDDLEPWGTTLPADAANYPTQAQERASRHLATKTFKTAQTHDELVRQIGTYAQRFDRPVQLLEGDSHVFRVGHPYTTTTAAGQALFNIHPATPSRAVAGAQDRQVGLVGPAAGGRGVAPPHRTRDSRRRSLGPASGQGRGQGRTFRKSCPATRWPGAARRKRDSRRQSFRPASRYGQGRIKTLPASDRRPLGQKWNARIVSRRCLTRPSLRHYVRLTSG